MAGDRIGRQLWRSIATAMIGIAAIAGTAAGPASSAAARPGDWPQWRGPDLVLRDNRIFGTGYHPIGIGSGQGYSDVKVASNYIQVQGTKAEERWKGGQGGGDPEGQLHPVNGIRLQRPRQNIEHRDNAIVVKGSGEGCLMRGLWLTPDLQTGENILFRDNTIKLIAQDDKAQGYALACLGEPGKVYSSAITLTGNTVITNLCHVQFGDNDGHGGLYRFLSNTFVKVGDDPRYRTVRMGWQGWKYESFGHLFVDAKFEGGASFESVSFDGAQAARYDFSVGWLLELQTAPGASVVVKDAAGATAFTGEAPQDGKLSIPLAQYVQSRGGRTPLTPHSVSVEKRGASTSQSVKMEENKSLKLMP